jgi:hypothetical protein
MPTSRLCTPCREHDIVLDYCCQHSCRHTVPSSWCESLEAMVSQPHHFPPPPPICRRLPPNQQCSVHGEDPTGAGELFHCADGFITLVPVTVAPLSPSSPPVPHTLLRPVSNVAADSESGSGSTPPAGSACALPSSAPCVESSLTSASPSTTSDLAGVRLSPLHEIYSFGRGEGGEGVAAGRASLAGHLPANVGGCMDIVPVRLPFTLQPATPAQHIQMKVWPWLVGAGFETRVCLCSND